MRPVKGVDEALDELLGRGEPLPAGEPLRNGWRVRVRRVPYAVWLAAVSLAAVLLSGAYAVFLSPPRAFPVSAYLEVRQGAALNEVSLLVTEEGFVRSPAAFKAAIVLLGGTRGIKAGTYYFSEVLSVLPLSWRLARGKFHLEPVRVTIPEGLNNREAAELLARALPRFDDERFLSLAREKEGYLFPDTYFFLPTVSEEEVMETMGDIFSRRIASLETGLSRFGKPLSDIIIMASLLEEEARTDEARRTIAGVLWKRLAAGMPLQVDAVFPYIFGGRPFDLTDGDLLIDSPYNTYKYAGLPPSPISNPGLNAIRAAITPLETPYWYYLSDREGAMHYARTHEEHLVNKERYLR